MISINVSYLCVESEVQNVQRGSVLSALQQSFGNRLAHVFNVSEQVLLINEALPVSWPLLS